MFTNRLTRAPLYMPIKSVFLAIGYGIFHDLPHTFLKRSKLLRGEIAFQKHFCFYRYWPNMKIVQFFLSSFFDNFLISLTWTSRTSRQLLEENAPLNDFGRRVPSAEKYGCNLKRLWRHFVAMTTSIFDVIITLIITNVHLYLIQL